MKYADYSQGFTLFNMVNPAPHAVNIRFMLIAGAGLSMLSGEVASQWTIDYLPKLCHPVYEAFQ